MLNRISLYTAIIATGGLMYLPIVANAKEDGSARGPSFERVDTDGDGMITKAELAAMGAARFAKVDRNGDGFISQNEAQAMHEERAKRRANRMMSHLDSDGDGRLSVAEMKAGGRADRMFSRVDKDGDGVISKAEFDVMKERLQGQRKP